MNDKRRTKTIKDTDSLNVYRLQRLRNQPKTVRGRCILFYASLSERPCARVFLFIAFALFTLLHTASFCIMLYIQFEDEQGSLSVNTIMLPLLLMAFYPIFLVLMILIVLIKDMLVKQEGPLVWHRNSIGILVQRFFFSLAMCVSMILFQKYVQLGNLKRCLELMAIPLLVVCLIIFLKVLCFREQRMYLWTGFIVCLIAQFIVINLLGDKIFNEDTDKVSECLLFIPCVTFGLVVDVQIIQSTRRYKPIAFTDLPFRAARGIMLAIGVLSLLMSLASYTFCILVVGGITKESQIRQIMFIIFIMKALTWSPFLGMEYYDLIFEQVYHDVQFQLNQITTGNSRSTSPRQRIGSKTSSSDANQKLAAIQEQNQETQGDESGDEVGDKGQTHLLIDDKPKKDAKARGTMQAKKRQQLLEGKRPSDVVSTDDARSSQNRLVIYDQNSMVHSITDGKGSYSNERGYSPTRTEIENQLKNDRQALSSSLQNVSSSEEKQSIKQVVDSRNEPVDMIESRSQGSPRMKKENSFVGNNNKQPLTSTLIPVRISDDQPQCLPQNEKEAMMKFQAVEQKRYKSISDLASDAPRNIGPQL